MASPRRITVRSSRAKPLDRTAKRYANLRDLRAAVQQHALDEWNGDPERPPWDPGGVMLKNTAPFTPDPDSITYLTEEAARELRERFEEESLRRSWERRARELMRTLACWIADVDKLLTESSGDEAFFGLAMYDLRTLWKGESSPPRNARMARDLLARPEVEAWRTTRPDSDEPRADLVSHMFSGMVTFGRRAPTNREFALASLLCGFFPEDLQTGMEGSTVAEVIAAEVRAMREARRRFAERHLQPAKP